MPTIITHATIFDGDRWREDHAVIYCEGVIEEVLPSHRLLSKTRSQIDLGGQRLVPGFIDLQVNGGGGVLFNEQPTLAGIKRISQTHRAFGTTSLLPTLISDTRDTMTSAITAIADVRRNGMLEILGVHLEGPFLSHQKRGIHDARLFRPPATEDLLALESLHDAVVLLTVAPDAVDADWIRAQVAQGRVLSVGHSAASMAQTQVAIAAGVSGFTHLFNAMSGLESREPGVVGAALLHDGCWAGIIADGHHVHPDMIRLALTVKPAGTLFLVTDAMPSVGTNITEFNLHGREISVRDGCCYGADGTLAGSQLTMIQAIRNIIAWMDLDDCEALRMASLYPAAAIGLDDRLGRIAAGYRADFVLLDDDFQVIQTWVGGVAETHSADRCTSPLALRTH